MRAFRPEREHNEQAIERNLRINDPSAIYARRSDPTAKNAKKDKSQSREMQTDDLIKWAMRQGWTRELLHEYFADLGLSGTLRPDERPDMLRLFEDIDVGKLDNGTIICFQENRLFRDETQIYYNQLIDKCRQHNILVVVISPRLVIYDLRDDTLRDIFREKLKEAAEYIPRHIKGWLIPARERAAWEYGEWAGMGSLPPGFIVDCDAESETYKKAIPYWPHIAKNKEMFQLFMELGGDRNLFFNRLRQSPIVYPEFEPWVDKRVVNMFKLSRYPGGGYYLKGQLSLLNLLMHPLHYGYRPVKGVIRRNELGEKIREFEPVIDLELLDFAYYRIAQTDFDGKPINNSKPPRRYFHEESDDQFGLLKYRIISNQGEVRTRRGKVDSEDSSCKTGRYAIETVNQSDYVYRRIADISVLCEELDAIIVKRLMEHVRDISKKRESVETYQQQVDTIRKKRQSRIKQLEASIQDIEAEQKRLATQVGKKGEENTGGGVQEEISENQADTEGDQQKKKRSARAIELVFEQIDLLEEERQKLLQTIAKLKEEVTKDAGSLDEELEELETLWPEHTFERRRTLINFAIREVVIDCMSTNWIRIQVLWLHEEWGREELFYLRKTGRRKHWTNEEKQTLAEHYPSMSRTELMALLPDRTWQSILTSGSYISTNGRRNIAYRKEDTLPDWARNFSHSDLTFMREYNLEGDVRYTNWISQSSLL